jgi:hypothetical protein
MDRSMTCEDKLPEWEAAMAALNPYDNSSGSEGSDVRPLIALLLQGKPVPPRQAEWLAMLLDEKGTAKLFGFGLVMKKFPRTLYKHLQRIKYNEAVYDLLKSKHAESGKLESAIAEATSITGISRAKLMQIWSLFKDKNDQDK